MGLGVWFRKHIIESVVKDVPAELYACELCDERSCTESKFATCEYRIRSEFLERKGLMMLAKKSADSGPVDDADIGAFDVMPLSPGILPDVASRTRVRQQGVDSEDSSAKSGFRAAVGNRQAESVAQSVTIELNDVDPGAPTRRSAKNS